jgi:oligosaccharide repeat unit polymerase
MIVYLSSGLARAGVFMGIVAMISVLILNARFHLGKKSNFSLIKYFLIISLAFFLIFFISAYGRVQNEQDIFQILTFKLGEYSLAMYEALFFWADKYDFTTLTFGRNTFTVVYKLFGYSPPQGFYEDVAITSYGETVIYTVFRGVIEDFSIFSVLFFFIVSLSISFYSKKNIFTKLDLILVLFSLNFILYPFISIYSVSTFFIAMIIFVYISRIKLYENS